MDIESLFADDTAQQLMRAIEPLTKDMHYVLLVCHPSGGALQLSNVDPKGQRYYLDQCITRMDGTEPTRIEKLPSH